MVASLPFPPLLPPHGSPLTLNLGNLNPAYVSSAQLLAVGIFIYQSEITWRQGHLAHLTLCADSLILRAAFSIKINRETKHQRFSLFHTYYYKV